jgi:hypothetical protein
MSVFYQDLLERANYVLQDQLLELKNALADYTGSREEWDTDLPVLECLAHNVVSQIQFIQELESEMLDQAESFHSGVNRNVNN